MESIVKFWDKNTSWQFSKDSFERRLSSNKTFGVFQDGKCVGYSILYPKSGLIAQIAVDKNHRRKNIASNLVEIMQYETVDNIELKFSNVDNNMKSFLVLSKK